jgi:hypothetical protein
VPTSPHSREACSGICRVSTRSVRRIPLRVDFAYKPIKESLASPATLEEAQRASM